LITPETFAEGSEDLLAFETDVLAIQPVYTSDDVFAIVCCDDYYEYDPYEDIGAACSSGAYEYDPYEDSGEACSSGAYEYDPYEDSGEACSDFGAASGGVQNPEPASLVMIAAGVLGVAGLIRRRRAKR
ncbi:MAG: PEP-CTERM sorting domain-containing protein, partial [Planctomycetota bacterium]